MLLSLDLVFKFWYTQSHSIISFFFCPFGIYVVYFRRCSAEKKKVFFCELKMASTQHLTLWKIYVYEEVRESHSHSNTESIFNLEMNDGKKTSNLCRMREEKKYWKKKKMIRYLFCIFLCCYFLCLLLWVVEKKKVFLSPLFF